VIASFKAFFLQVLKNPLDRKPGFQLLLNLFAIAVAQTPRSAADRRNIHGFDNGIARPGLRAVWPGLFTWLMTVVLLPFGMSEPIRRVLKRRSNRDNGLLLVSWIVLVILSAWMFWGWSLSIFPLMLALTLTSGVSVAWFGLVCSRLK